MTILFRDVVFFPNSPAFLWLPQPVLRPEPVPARFPCHRSAVPAGALLFGANSMAPVHLLAMKPTETLRAHPVGAELLIQLYSLCFSVIQIDWEEASWN